MNYISNDKEKEHSNKGNNYDTLDLKKNTNQSKDIKNETDSLITIMNKASNDKVNKIIRFAEDYCRASPNITLKKKSLLNIGWRTHKYNYDVDFEVINFKGEMITVYNIFIL